ncbi:MAG: methyltransferase domain-containing protein, partial [Candidatus Margulisiibacteriota bacterium]
MVSINSLPCILKDYLKNTHGAQYEKDAYRMGDGVSSAVYLGTYFPRSYVEIYNVLNNVISKTCLSDIFKNKKEIYILDIGSGTGANIISIIDLLKKLFGKKNCHVISIDKDQASLDIQNDILNHFYNGAIGSRNLKSQQFNSIDDFKKETDSLLRKLNYQYDFITCSKFVNEIYNKNYNGGGLFKELLEFAKAYLTDNGLFYVSDITNEISINGNKYFPEIMNNEFREYFKENSSVKDISLVLPIPCALWINKCRECTCFSQLSYNMINIEGNTEEANINYKVFIKTKDIRKTINTKDL